MRYLYTPGKGMYRSLISPFEHQDVSTSEDEECQAAQFLQTATHMRSESQARTVKLFTELHHEERGERHS